MVDGLKNEQTEALIFELRLRGYEAHKAAWGAFRCLCGHLPYYEMRGGKNITEHELIVCGNCGRMVSAKRAEEALRKWNRMIWEEEDDEE